MNTTLPPPNELGTFSLVMLGTISEAQSPLYESGRTTLDYSSLDKAHLLQSI